MDITKPFDRDTYTIECLKMTLNEYDNKTATATETISRINMILVHASIEKMWK